MNVLTTWTTALLMLAVWISQMALSASVMIALPEMAKHALVKHGRHVHPHYLHFAAIELQVNECAINSDMCSPDARCIDLPDGFQCICNDGFTGDGQTCTGE